MHHSLSASWSIFKRRIYITLLLIFIFFGVAKSQITIQGSISDSLGNPLPFVSISLKSTTSQLGQSHLSDSAGVYHFELQKAGYYQIQFSSINYYTKKIQAYFSHDTAINIQLKKNTHYLQAIEITSRKPIVERKIDRVIYNIQNIASITGGDALDALRKLPGIRVQNGGISLIGKSGVNIMLNDRITPLSGQNLLTFLKSLPSNQISKIEVITTPPCQI